MPSKPSAVLSDATTSFRNGLRRMTNAQPPQLRARGKENSPPYAQYERPSSPTLPMQVDPHRWDPVDGMIIIKVSVPSTDDIWRFKVPQNISLTAFRAKVELKVGFSVSFTNKQSKRIASQDAFHRWVAKRVKNGRNHPITANRQHDTARGPQTPMSPLSPTFSSTPASPTSPTGDIPGSFFDMSF